MSLKLVKPINELIAEYETLINPMFEEIKTLAQKNQTLQQTRDLLLPRLISGKLSVEGLAEKEGNLLIKQDEPLLIAAEPSVIYS